MSAGSREGHPCMRARRVVAHARVLQKGAVGARGAIMVCQGGALGWTGSTDATNMVTVVLQLRSMS
jgi:hypothetical protein